VVDRSVGIYYVLISTVTEKRGFSMSAQAIAALLPVAAVIGALGLAFLTLPPKSA
jgi:hypothetical protein